ncbi:MAG: phage terminase large subunit family protein [Pirellulales bacterium]
MKSDPRQLKPGELVRLLNSTPAGEVITDRRLRAHRAKGGIRIGDGTTIDLIRYAAWLATQPRPKVEAPIPAVPLTVKPPVDLSHVRDAYEVKKERERKRNAEKSKTGRDIGLEVEEARKRINWKRRTPAMDKLLAFLKTYCADDFSKEPSTMHLEVIETLESCVREGGWFALAMPRGSGKTTLTVGAALWAILTGRTPFVVVLAATGPKARALMERIKRILETNALLAEDFPEVCLPIRALERVVNRCKGQRYLEKPTFIEYGKDQIVLPTVPNSPSSGAVILCGGLLGSAVRGPLYKHPDGRNLRPTLAICDDPQTGRSAKSKTQTDERVQHLKHDVTGMAGPGSKMAIIVPCTVIREGDMADQLLDRELNPDYQGRKYQLLKGLPKNVDLWKEYFEIYRRCKADGKPIAEATKFYKKHRKAMDEGCDATWSERYNDDEISAIQHAVTIWLRDPEYFAAEMQNAPLKDEAAEPQEWYLPAIAIAARVNRIARCVVPNWAKHVVSFVDVQKRLLYWLVAAVGDGFTMSVVDYGTWPDQKSRYFTNRNAPRPLKAAKGQGFEDALLAAIESLTRELFEREWKNKAGHKSRIERMLIDSGYETDLVHRAYRNSPYRTMLFPSRGYGVKAGTRYNQFHATPKPYEQVWPNIRLNPQPSHESRLITFDSNYWKTFLHQRIATAAVDGRDDNGSCTLYGSDAREHRLLSEHLTSEKVAPRAIRRPSGPSTSGTTSRRPKSRTIGSTA